MGLAENRNPVATFEQAKWWLICHSPAVVDFIENSLSLDDMPLEAVIVCDIFWLTKEQLRAQLVRALREIDTSPRPVPVRSYRRRGIF